MPRFFTLIWIPVPRLAFMRGTGSVDRGAVRLPVVQVLQPRADSVGGAGADPLDLAFLLALATVAEPVHFVGQPPHHGLHNSLASLLVVGVTETTAKVGLVALLVLDHV